jgi:hypothetical protein
MGATTTIFEIDNQEEVGGGMKTGPLRPENGGMIAVLMGAFGNA